MILLQLFWSFCKIGMTSFGGLSMVPLINDEMIAHGWMTGREVADIVAMAEMTPGPLGLNCATFAGTRTAGLAGALAANLGVLFPTLTLCALAALFYLKVRSSRLMGRAMLGVRPACLGLMLGVAVSLALSNYVTPDGRADLRSAAIGLVSLVLLTKFHWSVPKTIAAAAVMGLLCFGGAALPL